jgi:hypothetical protein
MQPVPEKDMHDWSARDPVSGTTDCQSGRTGPRTVSGTTDSQK